jgi:predicted Zn-dependent protease
MVAAAEALRQHGDWQELANWVASCDWSGDKKFLKTLYALAAARSLNQTADADQLWQAMLRQARANGGQGLFAADLIYAWGWTDDAVSLLWIVADEPNSAALALGTLVRHYQSQRDADGQYRAYARLHALRLQDVGIANNFAYFAILTGNANTAVEQIVRENHEKNPPNQVYLSTYAFWLVESHRADEALQLLKPVADGWKQSPPVAFAYGLALAGTGHKAEARTVLETLKAGPVSIKEEALIDSRLN